MRPRRDAFVKSGPADALWMFEAEAEGLSELAAAGEVRVPEVYECGIDGGHAFIAMEKLLLETPSPDTESRLGTQLAALHRHTAAEHGWHRDNTIGLTPQSNARSKNWVEFYRTERLDFQFGLAASNGYGGELQELGAKVRGRVGALFDGYEPVPSLLHGDLWCGNRAAAGGEPVIFDPAVYYGDRETDLAMTRLFGGFGREFYRAYESAWPLAPGHERRLPLYQLYHVLNHLNLFGHGYHGQAVRLCREILSN
jgi:protein-ribulosamine 3-kinase